LKNRLNLETAAVQLQKPSKLQILGKSLPLDFLFFAALLFSFSEGYEKQSLSYQGKPETKRCFVFLTCHLPDHI